MEEKVTSQTELEGLKRTKRGRVLKSGLRLILAYCCLMVGLTQASRLSEWNEGSLVYKHSTNNYGSYHGKVTRDYLTGDYRVLQADGTQQVVPQEEVKEVNSKSSGINYRGMLSATLGFALAMLCLIRNPFRSHFKRSY